MFDHRAREDFYRARRRAFWRRLGTWFTGKSNLLLPYDEVRRQLPVEGQRYRGLQSIPLDRIVGSVGRYRDFDRAFLPTQDRTTQRWVSIGSARYLDVELPPVEVYQIGDVYFVRDGNHRVSVARERGQAVIDALVTEVTVPISITLETELDDIVRQRDYAQFLKETGLRRHRPDADLELTNSAYYDRLHEHIQAHGWYLGEEWGAPVPFAEAALSWYDSVYRPLVASLAEVGLPAAFPDQTRTDLYLWVSEYQWLRREAWQANVDRALAARKLTEIYGQLPVDKLVRRLDRGRWLENMILNHEWQQFAERTNITTLLPQADLRVTSPGQYERLLEHIRVHRWYLGEQRGAPVSWEEAVVSWYGQVYSPIAALAHQDQMLADFPHRTLTDLYLWIVDNRTAIAASAAGPAANGPAANDPAANDPAANGPAGN